MPERLDRRGQHKTAFLKNKRIIFDTQEICGICGLPVDKTLKPPDPMSKTVDHIIPVAKGGHPSSLDNLQLAHRWCNLHKGDRLFIPGSVNNPGLKKDPAPKTTGAFAETTQQSAGIQPGRNGKADNDNLPQHADWTTLQW